MAFREATVIEVREVLPTWLSGAGCGRWPSRPGKIARQGPPAGIYVEAAQAAGLVRDGGACQLTDELIGEVVEQVRPRGGVGGTEG